jgi:surfeit locus 1 family protein
VTVDGRVRPSQLRGLIGPRDPATGRLTAFARVDIARIGQQITAPLLPAYLELTSPAPSGDLPRLVPPPELDDGPHLSYALQWFSFTLMAAATWWLMLRRSAKAATKSSLARAAAAVAATAAIEAEAASGPAAISGESDRPAG